MRHSGEQKLASPEPRWIARSAGIQVPQLSQRTNLFFEDVRSAPAVPAALSVAEFNVSTILRISFKYGRRRE